MASTPSASALSAVLRCRRNIWTMNPPTKRPATSACSLGLAGVALRNSPAERTRQKASSWEAFLQGDRVVFGRRLNVSYKSHRVCGKMLRENDFRKVNELYFPKLSQSPGNAHSAVQNALVRQLANTLTSNLPGLNKSSKLVKIIKLKTCTVRMCKIVFVEQSSGSPAGALKVSLTPTCLMENAGHLPSFLLSGWSTLKNTCLSLTALVSEMMLLWRSSSSPGDAPHHLYQQKNLHKDAQQGSGQIHNPTGLTSSQDNCCGQKITEDRPD